MALTLLNALAEKGADDTQLAASARGLAVAYFEMHKRPGE
jgi:hypothetical protein